MRNIHRGLRWLFSSSIPRSFEPYWTMYMGVAIGWTSFEQRMTIFESTAISRPCGGNHELVIQFLRCTPHSQRKLPARILHFPGLRRSFIFPQKMCWLCDISSVWLRLVHILSFVLEKYHTIPQIEVDDYVWTRISDFRTMTQRWHRQTPAKIVDFLGSRSWVKFIDGLISQTSADLLASNMDPLWNIKHQRTWSVARCVAQFRLLRALVFQIYCLSKLHTLEHQMNK